MYLIGAAVRYLNENNKLFGFLFGLAIHPAVRGLISLVAR